MSRLGSLGLLVCVLSSLAAGCGGSSGFFRTHAFVPRRALYRLEYVSGATGAAGLLSPPWMLDNYALEPDGRVGAERTQGEFEHRIALDADGDGDVDRRVREPLYDVRYRHRRTGALLWTRIAPMPAHAEGRELSALAHQYVESTSGGTYVGVDFGGVRSVEERRFAPRIVQEQAIEVDGVRSYAIRFELIDVDRHHVDEDATGTMIDLALIPLPRRWTILERRGVAVSLPALLVVGLAVPAQDHARVADAFHVLLSRVAVLRLGEVPSEFVDESPRGQGATWFTAGAERSADDEGLQALSAEPEPASELEVGDWVMYRAAGAHLPVPVTLQERIVAREGLRLEIEVTLTRGEEIRRFIQVVTDTDEGHEVEALYSVDEEGARRELELSALQGLYEWVLLPLGGTPASITESEETRVFAGARYTCSIRRGEQAMGARRVRFERASCPEFNWTHGPTRYVDAQSGEVLSEMEVVGAGER